MLHTFGFVSINANLISIDGYENQDAEFIGEGNLTLVYKTKPIDGTYLPMALKVFKVIIIKNTLIITWKW